MAVEKITSEGFKDFINQQEVVIVDFWATWCGPCRMLGPVLEQLNAQTGVKVGKVNVDDEEAIAQIFNIRSIPTLIAFKEGKLVGRAEGFMPLEKLKAWVNSL